MRPYDYEEHRQGSFWVVFIVATMATKVVADVHFLVAIVVGYVVGALFLLFVVKRRNEDD